MTQDQNGEELNQDTTSEKTEAGQKQVDKDGYQQGSQKDDTNAGAGKYLPSYAY